ncbi:MAG: potassium transporter TrkG [Dehalococcoidia bacterium]
MLKRKPFWRRHAKQVSANGRTRDKQYLGPFHPSWLLIGFFLALIFIGTILLLLPGATASGHRVSVMDAMFTATSAATGTGLVIQDTISFWSLTGQRIIMGLILVGGLGALIGSTMLLLLIARRVNKQDQSLIKNSMGTESARGIRLLIFGIILYAFMVQLVGAYLLASRLSDSISHGTAWWLGAFHAVSSFNNAGFEIIGMAQKPPDTSVQLIIAGLSILGSISFIIVIDLIRRPFRKRLLLDTKLALIVSGLLLAIGMAAILITEANNPQTFGPLSFSQKIVSAFCHSASARTTGLATVNLAAFANATSLIIIALMFIGGTSGSNAGGIKVNTFALLPIVTWSFVRGKKHVELWGTRIHEEQLSRALAIIFLAAMLVFSITVLLSLTEGKTLLDELFETVSAFSTTGYSLGITSALSDAGKLLIAFTMFVGRVGPVTLAFALSTRHRPTYHKYTEEVINLG